MRRCSEEEAVCGKTQPPKEQPQLRICNHKLTVSSIWKFVHKETLGRVRNYLLDMCFFKAPANDYFYY